MRAKTSQRGKAIGIKGSPRKLISFLLVSAVFLAIMGSLTSVTNGRAEEEAQKVELRNVQQAVSIMMADNRLAAIPNPVVVPTNDMTSFPDATTLPEAKGLLQGDRPGYVLHGHDETPDRQSEPTIDYISSPLTPWAYTVTRDGVVVQGEKVENR